MDAICKAKHDAISESKDVAVAFHMWTQSDKCIYKRIGHDLWERDGRVKPITTEDLFTIYAHMRAVGEL